MIFRLTSLAQDVEFGGGIGLSINLGTHIDRIGVSAKFYALYDFVQINAGSRLHYNFKSLGPRLSGAELQTNIGLTIAFGYKNAHYKNQFISAISNQSKRPYSFSYSYLRYFDQVETSQASGIMAIGIDRVQLVLENDLFGEQGEDKYRTSAFKIAYTDSVHQFAIKTILWTGNKGVAVENSDYPSRFGYRDLSKSQYGKLSHGILAVDYKQLVGFQQVASISYGIDSEKIRHIFQNRLIHDMIFLPKAWVKTVNHHIPMLDTEGSPYIFKENQKIKKMKYYSNFGINSESFY